MYELRSRVRYSETDEQGKLSIAGLMNYLQDCCTMQAEDLGIGLDYLKTNHIGWIVTSYQIKLLCDMPKVGDEIAVRTWPYHFRGMLGYRNFTVTLSTGELLVEADSLWVLMDLKTGKPVRLPEAMVTAYQLDPQIAGQWHLKRKIFLDDGVLADSFTVSNMHLDTNHHMNNVNYIMAAAACLRAAKNPSQIFVSFKKAAMLGDTIHCYLNEQPKNATVALRDNDEEDFCVVQFEY